MSNTRSSAAGVTWGPTEQKHTVMFTLNSWDLRTQWVSMISSDFIQHDFIPEGHGQVASGSASLPDPAFLETEEQRLEREQNERDVLEALGEH